MIIGLTGKYCAGKNYIASFLEERGLAVLDIDKLGYQTLETEKERVFARFGADLKRKDGSLDRRLLGRRVFWKKEELAALEAVVHPVVNLKTGEWIGEQTVPMVLNAALLHKSAFFDKLDIIIIVTAPFFTRLLRAKRRDKLSWLEIFKRFSSQRKFNSQYLSAKAEIYKVENSNIWRNKTKRRIDKIIEGINQWKKNKRNYC